MLLKQTTLTAAADRRINFLQAFRLTPKEHTEQEHHPHANDIHQRANQRTMKTSELVRRFLPYFRPYRGMLALDLFCAMLTTLCDLVLPMIVRSITGLASSGAAALTVAYVLKVGGVYVLLRLVDTVANYIMVARGHVMGTYIERDMRHALFEHLQEMGFAYYSNAKVGQIMARITTRPVRGNGVRPPLPGGVPHRRHQDHRALCDSAAASTRC